MKTSPKPKTSRKTKITLAGVVGVGVAAYVGHQYGVPLDSSAIENALEPILCVFFGTCES